MCLICLGFYCTTGLRLRFALALFLCAFAPFGALFLRLSKLRLACSGDVSRSRHRVMVQLKIFAKLINIVDKNKINVAFFV